MCVSFSMWKSEMKEWKSKKVKWEMTKRLRVRECGQTFQQGRILEMLMVGWLLQGVALHWVLVK